MIAITERFCVNYNLHTHITTQYLRKQKSIRKNPYTYLFAGCGSVRMNLICVIYIATHVI